MPRYNNRDDVVNNLGPSPLGVRKRRKKTLRIGYTVCRTIYKLRTEDAVVSDACVNLFYGTTGSC